MDKDLVARASPTAVKTMKAVLGSQERPLSDLQIQAARAYGNGMKRIQIARAMLDALVPNKERTPESRMGGAYNKLKRWERNQKFRDLVYSTAVTRVDMQTPAILNGVTQKAVRGRVDAARLALEITGRHNPKGDQSAPSVVIAIDGIRRPTAIGDAEVVDADAVER